ncbi:MAG TPA: hypothetical protein VGM81_01570 [Burkholderiaceae bacterium]|jgi:hypothetical protein
MAFGFRATSALILGCFACASTARAAHPLQTEDTGTQGVGNFELENGLTWSRTGSARDFIYQPQVSYGLTPTVDLLGQPSWISHRDESGATSRAAGDTNLDAKWRFFGSAPLSLALRAGLTLATSGDGLGNPHGKVAVHGLIATTYDAAPFTVHANLGLAQAPDDSGQRTPQRTHIATASAAFMWALSEQLILTVDGSTSSNPDPQRKSWAGTMLAGAIYTIKPGLDADIGWRSSLGPIAATRQWLLGLTYRFAL